MGISTVVHNSDICFVLFNLQAALYYCVRFGFKEIGYKGLETGSRQISAHVVQQNKVRVLSIRYNLSFYLQTFCL